MALAPLGGSREAKGLQQAPAMGRAISELLVYGEYRSLDMSPFSYHRIERGEKFIEKAII